MDKTNQTKLNYLTKEIWSEIALYGAYSSELDWFALDRANNLAVLTASANAPIPVRLFTSYDRYIKITEIIASLPKVTMAELSKGKEGIVDSWLLYAEKGLFAYDYYDEQKTDVEGFYDLIARPEKPLKLSDIAIDKELYKSLIELNCFFSEGDIRRNMIPK